LRRRPEDIPLLVRYFVQQVSRCMGKRITTIPSGAMEKLALYPGPAPHTFSSDNGEQGFWCRTFGAPDCSTWSTARLRRW
jgi:hypothetical protein